jgi:hypothetical protein
MQLSMRPSNDWGPVDILICNHGIGSAHEKVLWEAGYRDLAGIDARQS